MSTNEEPLYTADDLNKTAGMSYRQVNDWDAKGVLPEGERASETGWRKYTGRELFVIMVCAEMRRRFNVPLESLAWMSRHMLQKGADHLAAAVRLMADLGLSVFILTDFKETFLMDSELEFEDLFANGYFGDEAHAGYVLIKVNPIVNKLLASVNPTVRIPNHRAGRAIVAEWHRLFAAASEEEAYVLKCLRTRSFRRIEVELDDGEIKLVTPEESVPVADLKEVASIVSSAAYQTVTITTQAGNIVAVKRRLPKKFK